MLDEVLLTIIKSLPVLEVLCKIDLFCCPECGLLVLVHLPDVVILDGKEHEPVRVFF